MQWESKAMPKMMLEKMMKNGHAICLKCSLEVNLFPSLQITWKGKHKSPHPRTHTPTSNGLKREIDQNC